MAISAHKFESLEAFIEHCDSCPKERITRGGSGGESFNFYGSNSYEEGREIVRHGVNVEKIDLQIKNLKEISNRVTIDIEHGVSGAVVDIGAYLEGTPECMMDFPLVQDVKFIDVVISTNDLGGVPYQVFDNKAIGTAYLVDKLENSGYRVRLTALGASSNVGRENALDAVSVVIKDYNEPLAIGQISGACSAAFFRRLVFRHREKVYGDADGSTCEYSAVQQVFRKMFAPGTSFIYLPNYRSMESLIKFDLLSTESAIKWAEHYGTNQITI